MTIYLRFEQRQLSIRVSHGERRHQPAMIGSTAQYRRCQMILAAYEGVTLTQVG